MKFHKSLAKYYLGWYYDACDSVVYCREHGNEILAQSYLEQSRKLLTIIMENWEAIAFFSIGDRAFLYDTALPEEFRGYE